MAITYEPIAAITLSSSVSSVTFSSISSSYTDLILILNLKSSGVTYNSITFNNDTSSNYSRIVISGNGSSAISELRTSRTFFEPEKGGSEINNNNNYIGIIQINNYSNSTTRKTILARTNNAATGTDFAVGTWRSTSSINTITLTTSNAATYSSGSTLILYGIKAA